MISGARASSLPYWRGRLPASVAGGRRGHRRGHRLRPQGQRRWPSSPPQPRARSAINSAGPGGRLPRRRGRRRAGRPRRRASTKVDIIVVPIGAPSSPADFIATWSGRRASNNAGIAALQRFLEIGHHAAAHPHGHHRLRGLRPGADRAHLLGGAGGHGLHRGRGRSHGRWACCWRRARPRPAAARRWWASPWPAIGKTASSGLIAQGIGTSMLQVGNILKRTRPSSCRRRIASAITRPAGDQRSFR